MALAVATTAGYLFHDTIINLLPLGGDTPSQIVGQSDGRAPVKVLTTPVKITPDNRIFRAVGTGRARLSVEIYPQVAEDVTAINFNAQETVDKGQVLVQLDDRREQLNIKLAKVRLEDAKSLLDRYEQAVKEGAVPQSEVDTARADYQAAQVELEQARLAVEERQIIAPFSGIVGIPNIDPGDRVTTDTLITGLDDRQLLYVDFQVPEGLAGSLSNAQKNRQKITTTTPAFPGRSFDGIIGAQEARLNNETRTLLARAEIQNRDDILRPGMSFDVRWEIKGDSYPTVPEIALQWGRDGSFVWVIRDGVAKSVPGRVVSRKAGLVLIDGDIRAGDNVVVEGVQRLRDGDKVTRLNGSDNG